MLELKGEPGLDDRHDNVQIMVGSMSATTYRRKPIGKIALADDPQSWRQL